MKVMIAVASEYVDALPKGAKINSFEVYRSGTNKMLGKDKAGTMKQIAKRLDYILPVNTTFDLVVIADHDGATRKVKESYTLKSTGLVKAQVTTAAAKPAKVSAKVAQVITYAKSQYPMSGRTPTSLSFTSKQRGFMVEVTDAEIVGRAWYEGNDDAINPEYNINAPTEQGSLVKLAKWVKSSKSEAPPFSGAK